MGKKKQRKSAKRTECTEHRKFRVGYLSEAFCKNRMAEFLPAFFVSRDRIQFEAYGYACCEPDEVTALIRGAADGWQNVAGRVPEEIALQIEKDGIDILVDLSYRETSKTIAAVLDLRPAPLQATLAERCAAHVDITAGDVTAACGSRWCYTPFSHDMDYASEPPCLRTGAVSFGVLGNLRGIERDGLAELVHGMEMLLAELPDARIVLTAAAGNVLQAHGLQDRLWVAGGEGRRISLADELPLDDLDIALAPPGVAAKPLCDALLCSVPVAGLVKGAEDFSRQVLEQSGLGQLAADDAPGLARAAAGLARDAAHLSELHQEVRWRLQSAPVMDVGTYAIGLERLYGKAWFRRGAPPKREKLLAGIRRAEKEKQWAAALQQIGELSAWEKPDGWVYMTAAWGYYFLGDMLRCAHWAMDAAKAGAPHPVTQQYLQAIAWISMKRWQKALACCNEASRLVEAGEPLHEETAKTLLLKRAGAAYCLGRADAERFYWKAHEECTDFEDRCQLYSSWLLAHNSRDVPEEELYQKHLGYNRLFKDIRPYCHDPRQRKGTKIRIGYISPDFCAHVMSYFCWPFLATYDQDRFEVYVYSIGKTDQYTNTFRTLVDCWRDIRNMRYEEVAKIIYKDRVDILFDLAGHTSNTGLPVLAWKPAPIQISGLGYMATTGLRTVDFFLTDGTVDPPGVNEAFFVERLLRIRTQFCYNGATNLPASQGAPARKRGWLLFGVFNQYRKITDEHLLLWKGIMERVPGSRLLVKNAAFADMDVIREAFGRMQGLGLPMGRVMFEPPTADYMNRYLDVDIALDTYPYPGGGTTCDALYMGVPVITRYSARHSTRFSYGILHAVGLAELGTSSPEAYAERAVGLAGDLELLDALHRNLRKMMQDSPLMDPVGYIREVEAHYKRIWKKFLEQGGGQDE